MNEKKSRKKFFFWDRKQKLRENHERENLFVHKWKWNENVNLINSCRKKKKKFICFHCGFICSTEKNIYNKSEGEKYMWKHLCCQNKSREWIWNLITKIFRFRVDFYSKIFKNSKVKVLKKRQNLYWNLRYLDSWKEFEEGWSHHSSQDFTEV